VNTQIVAATNRDLKAMVTEGTFRGDLYYRLLVAPIALTPLRARPADILPLAAHWLRRISAQHGNRVRGFTPEAEQRFLTYAWPGNVREIRNLIERLVILCPGDLIGVEQLPPEIAPTLAESTSDDAAFLYRMEAARAEADEPATSDESVPPPSLDEIGYAHIRMVLQKMNGNKTKAAEALGISRQTLRSRLSSAR
jgi:two-component system response regulator HydG